MCLKSSFCSVPLWASVKIEGIDDKVAAVDEVNSEKD